MTEFIAVLTLAVWLYLIAARGAFWRAPDDDDVHAPSPAVWPRVTAVIPARDEADHIGPTLRSLLTQDYAGPFSIVLVDDGSRDGTAAAAKAEARALNAESRLRVIDGAPPPAGWTGKLWAVNQGVAEAEAGAPDYLLLTDADIVYAPGTLTWLVARAQAKGTVLTSLMAQLRCESLAERALIPAFIFFFRMLYPFAWVSRRDRTTAAAAGGCMLARREALSRAGGIAAIRGALIDDCALARAMKKQGPIDLALTHRVRSTRGYAGFGDIRRMVARSAYAQLRYSPLLLLGTVAGLTLTYLAPVGLALFANGLPQALGALTWLLMAAAFQPVLRFYRLSPAWGLALPFIASTYMVFTVDSAYQHAQGRGGMWKGRAQANVSG
ncbi:MAG: glycosyltransferase [Pseudorhodoplanes sp.]